MQTEFETNLTNSVLAVRTMTLVLLYVHNLFTEEEQFNLGHGMTQWRDWVTRPDYSWMNHSTATESTGFKINGFQML